jgi:predicted RNase H-like HicB family nuclease
MTKQHLVVYEKEINNWGAYSPAIPGCGSTGDTLEEMRVMMTEAVEGHFQVMAEDGDPLPEPTNAMVDFSEETRANGVEYCVVEWLDVRMPSQITLAAQQPALPSATQDQPHHG